MTNRDSSDDYTVLVDHDPKEGIRVTMTVAKIPFVARFGDLPASREKALSTANRVAHDLGVPVRNKLPKNYEVSQSATYHPDIPHR